MSYKLSLYKPIEIEIEGTIYKVKKRNRAMMRALGDILKKYAVSKDAYEKIDVSYEQLKILIAAPAEVIDALDTSQTSEIWDILNGVFVEGKTESKMEDAEKNALKPGDVPAP